MGGLRIRIFRLRNQESQEERISDLTGDQRNRLARLRRKSNMIFALSFLVALGLHLALFLRSPTFEVPMLETSEPGHVDIPIGGDTSGTFLSVLFLPPEIYIADGGWQTEPPERVLDAGLVDVSDVLSSEECVGRDRDSIVPLSGRASVRVNERGRVDRAEVAESTGDECRDALIVSVARALWYRWLPNDEYPAPVNLIQPMSISRGTF